MSNPSDVQSPVDTIDRTTAAQRTPEDYRSRIKPVWCPGCGNFGVLTALMRAFVTLDIDPDNLALISGIGCSSRMPGFIKSYAFHGVHGRALPVALGVKLGNPHLKVVVIGGDGDGLSIGAGHFPHAARRNIDITYLLIDNRIYGLTKGQTSPTTPTGKWTKTAPGGVIEFPMNPVHLGIAYGATYVARCHSIKLQETQTRIEEAIRHPGFSLVQIMSRCITFGKGYGFEDFDRTMQPIPADHDVHDVHRALALVDDPTTIYTGVFYQGERPEYVEALRATGAARGRELDASGPQIDIERLIKRFS
jgi:2-oxoglutarate ferredoxin oxidoreductase subunit beta